MRLSIIVAMTRNRVIGRGGGLPWRLPADLQRFKRLTMGHPILMGRKTYASIGRNLPGRTSIVITHKADFRTDGVLVANSLPDAISLAKGTDEAFVVGGGEIYSQALPLADRMYLTLVETETDGDAVFPNWDPAQWRVVEESWTPADARNPFAMRFQVLDRVR